MGRRMNLWVCKRFVKDFGRKDSRGKKCGGFVDGQIEEITGLCGDFGSEVYFFMHVVKASQELLELIQCMWPDSEHIIYVAYPEAWLFRVLG